MVQQTFQQYGALKEDDCMVKFFETLKDFVSYDEEVFPCELVVSSNLVYHADTQQQSASSPHFVFPPNFPNIQHVRFSTARLEFVSRVGHWWERHSTAHTEERSGKRGGGKDVSKHTVILCCISVCVIWVSLFSAQFG